MTYEEMKPRKADRKKFDIDLEKGEIGEQAIADIFTNKKLEVKSEIDKWAKTGNICIEFESWGKPSGIAATEADYWVQNLYIKDVLVASIVLPVEQLKKLCKGRSWVKGGDNNASRMYLLKLKDIFTWISKNN